MIEETELIFREEQRFALWLRWLVVLSMVWIVPVSIVQLIKDSSEQKAHRRNGLLSQRIETEFEAVYGR